MGPFKTQTKMRRLKREKGESIIPEGCYCYGWNKEKTAIAMCPYWDIDENEPEQLNGYCWFLEKGDGDEGIGELWDQCKCCGINDYIQ